MRYIIPLIIIFLMISCTEYKEDNIYKEIRQVSNESMKIGRVCSQKDNKQTLILLEWICSDEHPCYPDPDDISIWDVLQETNTLYATEDGFLINNKDEIVTSFKKGERFRTVGIAKIPTNIFPKVADLHYDGRYGYAFVTDKDCSIFSDNILKSFGMK